MGFNDFDLSSNEYYLVRLKYENNVIRTAFTVFRKRPALLEILGWAHIGGG